MEFFLPPALAPYDAPTVHIAKVLESTQDGPTLNTRMLQGPLYSFLTNVRLQMRLVPLLHPVA